MSTLAASNLTLMRTIERNTVLLKPALWTILAAVFLISSQSGCSSNTTPLNAVELAAQRVNSRCPQMVDQITRMDSATVLSDSILQYHYTIVTQSKETVDVKSLTGFLVPGIIENIRESPGMKIQRDNLLTMIFSYRDKNGTLVTDITLRPGDYLE